MNKVRSRYIYAHILQDKELMYRPLMYLYVKGTTVRHNPVCLPLAGFCALFILSPPTPCPPAPIYEYFIIALS